MGWVGTIHAVKRRIFKALALVTLSAMASGCMSVNAPERLNSFANGGNPLIRDRHTADPAPLVVGDRLYLYVGHDEARGEQMFNITEWLAYSTTDMQDWTYHGSIMRPTDFSWASRDAWASQVHEKDGRYWFYTAVEHDEAQGSHGKAIGVAVADNPLGPFTDALGRPLVKNEDTAGPHHWDDIDPSVWTDADGKSYLFWGNANLYMAELADDMVSFAGPIQQIDLPDFVEGPWVFERDGIYYLAYASMDQRLGPDERISYATSPSITGPWTRQGEITGSAANSFTIHPGIAQFMGEWYLFYHVGTLTVGDQPGGLGRRAVAVERLRFDDAGRILRIEQTQAGILGE